MALLITNIEFTNPQLNRNGAEKDEENMETLLTALGYEVVKHRNFTAKVLVEKNTTVFLFSRFNDTVSDK